MAKKTANIDFIVPSIRSNDEKHILEELVESGDAPEIKAVGYARMGGGTNSWVSFVATIKGDKVLKMEVDEPNMRAIAEECTKLNFVKNIMDVELV